MCEVINQGDKKLQISHVVYSILVLIYWNHNPKSHKPSLVDKIADICCVPKRRTSVYPVSQSAVHLVHYGDSPRQAIRRQPRGTQADAKTNHKPTTDSSETRKLSNEGLTTISEESDSRKSSAESEVKMNDMSRH
nr:unnamed protein product [Haemonchus contortus]